MNMIQPFGVRRLAAAIQPAACCRGPQQAAGPQSGAKAPHSKGSFRRRDADNAPLRAFIVVLDDASHLCVQRVIAADADVLSRIEARAALTDENRSAAHELSREAFDSQHLGLRIAAVAR